ncbi:MFS transporter [bacterium]|nr:MFS transporter [bacterium]
MTFMRKNWFGIHAGEGPRAWRMFFVIFLLIASLAIIKPVRNSLFLNEYGAQQLPYAFLLVALASTIVAVFYTRLTKRFTLLNLIRATLAISVLSVIGFWALLVTGTGETWLTYALYIWVAIFGLITTTQFWLLANYVFFPRQAKRLFSFLGAGAISGGIIGGYLTRLLVEQVGTKHMLLICVLFLLIAIYLVTEIWRRSEREIEERFKARNRQERKELRQTISPWKRIQQSKHLTLTASLIGVGVIVANLVDFQFSAISSEAIRDEDELTAFFGFWLSNLSLLSLAVQLFGTSRIIKRFGVGASLYLLPTGIMIGSIVLITAPVLWAAILVKVSDGSFKQSVNKAGLELLILPIPASIKNQVKAIIDVFVDHLATGISGLLLILMTQFFPFGSRGISLLIVGIILIWYQLIRSVKKEYVRSFRLAIEKRTIDLDSDSIDVNDAAVHESLMKSLLDKSPRKVLYVLDLVTDAGINVDDLPLSDLLANSSQAIRATAMRLAVDSSEDYSAKARLLLEQSTGELRIACLVYLVSRDTDGIELLKEWVREGDTEQRIDAIHATGVLLRDTPGFRMQIEPVSYFSGLLDSSRLKGMPDSDAAAIRKATAQAIGDAGLPSLHTYLHTLLHDQDTDVLIEAVRAAGCSKVVDFAPALINHLDTKLVRRAARDALEQMGAQVVPYLAERIENRHESSNVRHGIARVFGYIGSQAAVDTLMRLVKTERELAVRDRMIRSLNRLKQHYPRLQFGHAAVEATLYKQLDDYHTIYKALNATRAQHLGSNRSSLNQARALLARALEERLDADLERIFRLLGLRYSGRQMLDAYQGVTSLRTELRDSALEFLDNLLDNRLKKALMPILEEMTPADDGERRRQEIVERDYLYQLASGGDTWLAACALFVVVQLGDAELARACSSLASHPDPVVAETAQLLNQPPNGEEN